MRTSFPKSLRVESKFTTGTSIVVPLREREALLSKDEDAYGVIAALFWSGNRDIDGRWFIVDAMDSFGRAKTQQASLTAADMRRLERSQSWLSGIRNYVEAGWPVFLKAFRAEALLGHKALLSELQTLHAAGLLRQRVPPDSVLDMEHRDTVMAILAAHGASVAGHIFQDLFAYLLALAGYRSIRINPVGVPDIEVSDFGGYKASKQVTVLLSSAQFDSVVQLCETAGRHELAEMLKAATVK